jgi:hypothetical protein
VAEPNRATTGSAGGKSNGKPDAGADAGTDPAGGAGSGASIQPLDGKTEINSLQIEASLLSLQALEEIAVSIATSLDGLKPKPTLVVLGDDALFAAIRFGQLLNVRIETLSQQLEALMKEPADTLMDAVGGLTTAIGSVAALLAYFRVETVFKGHEVKLKDSALQALLARELLPKGMQVVLPQQLAIPAAEGSAGSLSARLERLIDLKVQASQKYREDQGHIKRLIESVDEFLLKTFGPRDADGDKTSPLGLLLAAETVLRNAKRPAAILRAEIVAAGGNYQTRRTLFTTMFTGDRLSYCGGAAVSFIAFDLDDGHVLLADTRYYRTNYLRDPQAADGPLANFRPSRS